MPADSAVRVPIALARSPNAVAPAMTALPPIIESLRLSRRESLPLPTPLRKPLPAYLLRLRRRPWSSRGKSSICNGSRRDSRPRLSSRAQLAPGRSTRSGPEPHSSAALTEKERPWKVVARLSLRGRSTRRSVGCSRRRFRLRWFLLHRRLFRRLGVIHHNLFRWRRWRRGQRLDLRPQTHQLIFLARSQFLHAFAKPTTGALQSGHVVAQALKFIFGSECSRTFYYRAKGVIQQHQVAIELETRSQIFGRVVQLRDRFRQRLSLGRSVGLPPFDTRLLKVGLHALRRLLQLCQDAVQFADRRVSNRRLRSARRASRILPPSCSRKQGDEKRK